MIGNKLEIELFREGGAIGEEIMIASVPFEVVGILEPIGIDPHGEDRDMEVYVPYTTAQRRLANTDLVGMGKFVVSNADLVDEDAEEIAHVPAQAIQDRRRRTRYVSTLYVQVRRRGSRQRQSAC